MLHKVVVVVVVGTVVVVVEKSHSICKQQQIMLNVAHN